MPQSASTVHIIQSGLRPAGIDPQQCDVMLCATEAGLKEDVPFYTAIRGSHNPIEDLENWLTSYHEAKDSMASVCFQQAEGRSYQVTVLQVENRFAYVAVYDRSQLARLKHISAFQKEYRQVKYITGEHSQAYDEMIQNMFDMLLPQWASQRAQVRRSLSFVGQLKYLQELQKQPQSVIDMAPCHSPALFAKSRTTPAYLYLNPDAEVGERCLLNATELQYKQMLHLQPNHHTATCITRIENGDIQLSIYEMDTGLFGNHAKQFYLVCRFANNLPATPGMQRLYKAIISMLFDTKRSMPSYEIIAYLMSDICANGSLSVFSISSLIEFDGYLQHHKLLNQQRSILNDVIITPYGNRTKAPFLAADFATNIYAAPAGHKQFLINYGVKTNGMHPIYTTDKDILEELQVTAALFGYYSVQADFTDLHKIRIRILKANQHRFALVTYPETVTQGDDLLTRMQMHYSNHERIPKILRDMIRIDAAGYQLLRNNCVTACIVLLNAIGLYTNKKLFHSPADLDKYLAGIQFPSGYVNHLHNSGKADLDRFSRAYNIRHGHKSAPLFKGLVYNGASQTCFGCYSDVVFTLYDMAKCLSDKRTYKILSSPDETTETEYKQHMLGWIENEPVLGGLYMPTQKAPTEFIFYLLLFNIHVLKLAQTYQCGISNFIGSGAIKHWCHKKEDPYTFPCHSGMLIDRYCELLAGESAPDHPLNLLSQEFQALQIAYQTRQAARAVAQAAP